MSISLRSHRVAWVWAGGLAIASLVAFIVSLDFEQGSHQSILVAAIRLLLAIASAAMLAYGFVMRRLTADERVLSALVDQLQRSQCDAFSSEPVTNGRVVSLERAPASRTSAVPRPTGGRPFRVAQPRSPAPRR